MRRNAGKFARSPGDAELHAVKYWEAESGIEAHPMPLKLDEEPERDRERAPFGETAMDRPLPPRCRECVGRSARLAWEGSALAVYVCPKCGAQSTITR